MQGMASSWRMNHVQVTVPQGALSGNYSAIKEFYCDALGFSPIQISAFQDVHVFLTTDSSGGQFIYVSENANPMVVRADDHVGFHLPARAEVDRVLKLCKRVRERDPRMEIQELDDLDLPQTLTHSFYFRYLLPLWFDIQVIEPNSGHEPGNQQRIS